MALFDAWYFMRVFQYLTTSDEAVSLVERVISFLPGVVLALAMMLSGHAIAAPLHRVREWLHALRDRHPALSLIGSLALPVLYLVAVLSTVMVWAVVRAREAETDDLGTRYAPGWVAVLMLVLAITAVAMKVVAYNPYADSAAEARRGLLRARLTYAWLVRRVGDALREHEQAWSDLCAVRDELASHVRLESMRVWEAAILTARMLHGQAGNLPPAPAVSAGGAEAQAPTAAWVAPLFTGVVEPPPELGPLVEAQRIAATCDPTELRTRRNDLISRIDRQLAPA
ncbi:hypothetical protein ACFWN1_08235 [Streptomyces sp. NPDC058459]|uniref:hypothetical protein n=1 Tax=Streptomyces sp. NPDC058459 TaxID=3346508 RepID=UPI00365FE42A